MKAHAFFEQIKGAEAEHRVAQVAVASYQAAGGSRPAVLVRDGVEPEQIARCRVRLEGTYVVRVFAEFEAALRDAWARVRTTRPDMKPLIDSVAGRWSIPTDVTDHVHAVRDLRNDLVHSAGPAVGLTLAECRSRLCTFLGYIPFHFFLKPKK